MIANVNNTNMKTKLSAYYIFAPIIFVIIILYCRYTKSSWGIIGGTVGIAGMSIWFFIDFIKSLKEKNRSNALVSLVRAVILSAGLIFAYLNKVMGFFALE